MTAPVEAPAPPAPAAPRTPPPTGVLALRVLGLAGTLLLVGGGAAGLVAGFFEQRVGSTTALPASVATVDVDLPSGDVTVLVGSAGAASLTTTRRWSVGGEPVVTTDVSGGAMRLRAQCPPGRDGFSTCSVDVVLRVPAGTVVRAATDSGDVRVDGTTAGVTARTRSGDIRLAGTSGDLSARTTTGDVRVERSRSARVDASATTGDVRVELGGAPDLVRARTTTGDVTVLVPAGPATYRVTASTPVGDRTVDVPESSSSDRLVEATTTVGDVRVAVG